MDGHDICSQALNVIDVPMDFIIIKRLIGHMAGEKKVRQDTITFKSK